MLGFLEQERSPDSWLWSGFWEPEQLGSWEGGGGGSMELGHLSSEVEWGGRRK